MKKILFVLMLMGFYGNAQTIHQVCISEVLSSDACGANAPGVFVPGNLTIQVGDQIQFTTHFVQLAGYSGTHDIQFTGSPANNVLLPISTNILSPTTTVTTPPFNTPGTFAMFCANQSHCEIAELISNLPCTGYSVTVVGNQPPCDVEADFQASATTVCQGDTVFLTNASLNANVYQWSLDNTVFSNDPNPFVVLTDEGTFDLKLVAGDGTCEDSLTVAVTVNQTPTAMIAIQPSNQLTVGQELNVSFTPDNFASNATFEWDFCDGPNAAHASDFTVSWSQEGTFCLCVTIDNQNGCILEQCHPEAIIVSDEATNSLVESEKSSVVIFPNPSDGNIQLKNIPSNAASIVVFDMNGKRISTNNTWTNGKLDLQINDKGIFMLAILDKAGEQLFSERVIVK